MPSPSLTAGFDLPFQEQIDFFRAKINMPTEAWDDIWQAAHDRAFVVAGAMKADLLDDLRQAVDKAITTGTTLETFRKDFREIVGKHGWQGWTGEGTPGGFAWRTRVIYETNLRTSYAAGRWAQLTDPRLAKLMPFWRYVHNESVLNPRPLHQRWGAMRLTLPQDHPFWKTHFPPNGWGCRCRVTAVPAPGKADATDPPEGWDTPDDTGKLPGIDKGWGYAPGKSKIDSLRKLADEKVYKLAEPLRSQFKTEAVARLDASQAFSSGEQVGAAKPASTANAGNPVKGSLWRHPGTGQERIYFNGYDSGYFGLKVYAVQDGENWLIRFQGAQISSAQRDHVMDRIDRELEEWSGDRVSSWESLKKLFNKRTK